MRLALHLALRFLREGVTQSVLIVLGVSVGMATFVFVSALMAGLQTSMVERTLGSQAHITIERASSDPRALIEGEGLFARNILRLPAKAPSIVEWQKTVTALRRHEEVLTASPKISGSIMVRRGRREKGALLVGAEQESFAGIIAIEDAMTAGEYALRGDSVLIGTGLADELDLEIGDPLRIAHGDSTTTLRVGGVFSLGNAAVDDSWVLTSLRRAQGLLSRAGEVSMIDIRVADPFFADTIAATLGRELDANVTSWMGRNEQLLVALRSQDSTTLMIRLFVLLSVGMGISSVLVVSAVQRSSQIGIMRAIGMSRGRILQVFLLQGFVFGVAGSFLGTIVGAVLAQQLAKTALFDVQVRPSLVLVSLLIAIGVGVGAAWLPARRASRLDPAAAIRGGGG